MNLSVPTFTLLPKTGLESISVFAKLGDRVAKIGAGSGKQGAWFKERCAYFLDGAAKGQRLEDLYEGPRDFRVILHLWLTENKFRTLIKPGGKPLSFLQICVGRFKPAHCRESTALYLEHYESLEHPKAFAKILREQYGNQDAARLLQNDKLICTNAALLFADNAPSRVAKYVRESGETFNKCMRSIGLDPRRGGSFLEVTRRSYFVEVLKEISIGEVPEFFDELKDEGLRKSRYDDSHNLAQAVVTVMIERCLKLPKGMPESWMTWLLAFMGDPRLPKRSETYQVWWLSMDRKLEAAVRKWLAGIDLHLFLRVLEDSSDDEGLQRMYPARRAFLEGLLDHYDVTEARLFLSADAARCIKREYGAKALAAHGHLNSSTQSIIYLEVNGLYLFEGTHSYAARLCNERDAHHPVFTRARSRFSTFEFISGLDKILNGHVPSYIRHYPNLSWQKKLIDAFRQFKLKVRPEHVLTDSDYRQYRRKYGI